MFLILIKHIWESGSNVKWLFDNMWCVRNWGSVIFMSKEEPLTFTMLQLDDTVTGDNMLHFQALLEDFEEPYYTIITRKQFDKLNSNKRNTKIEDDLSEYFGMEIVRK